MSTATDQRSIVAVAPEAIHLRVPADSYPSGKTIAYARRRVADQQWEVRIMCTIPQETHGADDRTAAERLLLERTRRWAQ